MYFVKIGDRIINMDQVTEINAETVPGPDGGAVVRRYKLAVAGGEAIEITSVEGAALLGQLEGLGQPVEIKPAGPDPWQGVPDQEDDRRGLVEWLP